jgi:hypothetical protein
VESRTSSADFAISEQLQTVQRLTTRYLSVPISRGSGLRSRRLLVRAQSGILKRRKELRRLISEPVHGIMHGMKRPPARVPAGREASSDLSVSLMWIHFQGLFDWRVVLWRARQNHGFVNKPAGGWLPRGASSTSLPRAAITSGSPKKSSTSCRCL